MRIHAILAVLLCGAGPGMSRPAGNSRHRPAITIRVVNESAADARTISLARKEAMRIFAEAGIDLVWLDCDLAGSESGTGNACHQDRGPAEFWVRIVMRRPTATSGDVLGFAEIDERLGTGSAGIYYPAVEAVTRKWQVRAGEVLAAAISHEVGHLVLGAKAHSSRGVMQANWGRTQCELIAISELNFTPEEAKGLRERVETRMLTENARC